METVGRKIHPAVSWSTEPGTFVEEGVFHGLPYRIKVGPVINLTGHVGVPEHHSLFGAHRWDIAHEGLEVHGGVNDAGWRIVDGQWWIGFSTNYPSDTTLSHFSKIGPIDYPGSTVKDIDFVRAECEKLAEQLATRFGKWYKLRKCGHRILRIFGITSFRFYRPTRIERLVKRIRGKK